MGRLEVEHDVELADVAEVAVQSFHERVDQLERREAVVAERLVVVLFPVFSAFFSSTAAAAALFDPDEEEEGGVAAVDDADAAVVDEGALRFFLLELRSRFLEFF